MEILPATKEKYRQALICHIRQMPDQEVVIKGSRSRAALVDKYLAAAEYGFVPDFKPLIDVNMPVYVVVNSGIEYNLPHTLANIIILPKAATKARDIARIMNHELYHIYFRYNKSPALLKFMEKHSLYYIDRPRVCGEITNPDTTRHVGYRHPDGRIIFAALVDGGKFYKVEYFTIVKRLIYPATPLEKNTYNALLPYDQNYHPEEILANLAVKL